MSTGAGCGWRRKRGNGGEGFLVLTMNVLYDSEPPLKILSSHMHTPPPSRAVGRHENLQPFNKEVIDENSETYFDSSCNLMINNLPREKLCAQRSGNSQRTSQLVRALCLDIICSEAGCPIQLQPETVLVRYGDPVSVNCTVSEDHMGIGWEASEGSVDMKQDVQFITWSLEHLTDWEIEPKCYGNFMNNTKPLQCEKELKVIVYNLYLRAPHWMFSSVSFLSGYQLSQQGPHKTPDSVSISAVNHTDPMLEGEQYQLQCEVQNIAPVRYLTVKWYKGETLEDQTTYDDLTKTPVNVSSTLLITPTSTDDGAQYSCVAELELGPEGPELHPADTSEPLTITVHYSPSFVGPLEEQREVIEGEEGSLLNCHSNGNPPPEYSWTSPLGQEEKSSPELKISTSLSPGTHIYICSASNDLGSKTKNIPVSTAWIVAVVLSAVAVAAVVCVWLSGPIVLWSVIGVGILVAVVLIVGYIFLKSQAHGNSII
ncbi:hypothetical protein JZ751_013050 [Albula glossodonta]|uniref:Ig-like domain-containing protein n=1 Tax=Albula glossodonta TaxID=121402 RepID=A0A8T2P209_9TELE|nr:hypothetical protein JZ751_013050 [Albula glossodonta]